jgi:hypothetical protein
MRRDAKTVAGWNFERIIPCHGVRSFALYDTLESVPLLTCGRMLLKLKAIRLGDMPSRHFWIEAYNVYAPDRRTLT